MMETLHYYYEVHKGWLGCTRCVQVTRHIQKHYGNGGDFALLLGSAQGLLRVHKVCTGGQTYSEALDK